MSNPFVHLHLHTEYSIVDSVVRVQPLMDAVVSSGSPAVAMTDQCNLFAMVKFYRAALAQGLKPIIGAEIWLQHLPNRDPAKLVILCKDIAGYRSLSRLLTRAYQEGQHGGLPVVQRDWLDGEDLFGLLALSAGREGALGRALLDERTDEAMSLGRDLQACFGGEFFIELQRTGRPGEDLYNDRAVRVASSLGAPIVATNDVRFLDSGDYEAHEARVCIHQGRSLDDQERPRDYTAEQYLRSPAEMAELFSDLPEAIENSYQIALRCNLILELGTPHLPDYAVPENLSIDRYLEQQAQQGLIDRLGLVSGADFGAIPVEYRDRLSMELAVICGMGFPGYFLIVADFIRWSKANDIPVGPGRGSGAGSLVAYAVGITDLDPITHDLLFERFLNPERVSMPDFDIDFCMEGRDRVIEYVADRYGRDRVSQIITYGSMAAKAVVRDCGRVLGHPYGFVDRVAKLIPFELGITLSKALDQDAELQSLYENDDEVRALIDLARQLEGLVRNAGKHAGGVVIAPTAITDFTPLYRVEGEKASVTQFDKDDVESAGLVKFDFLGLRTLTIIDRAVKTINETRDTPLDIRSLPMDDTATYKLLQDCRTTAVFQLESRGMRDLIKRLQPDSFDDIVALVALFRPGPLQSGMVDDFIARKHGRDDQSIDYLHPDLEPVLLATYGVILYQEQVMQIAQRLAGYSLGEADLLRRAMGKKKPEEMAKQREIFLGGAVERQVDASVATRIFDLMEKFAGYGFNKSHSAAYAVLSYQTAWLKAHHPAAFMAAVLTSEMDDTDKLASLQRDCVKEGLTIEPPCVNASAGNFEISSDAQIRYGLAAIKGLGRSVAEAIVSLREQQPFVSLEDLCERLEPQRIGRRAYEALIKSGACDAFGRNRPSILAALPAALGRAEQAAHARNSGQSDLFNLGGAVADEVSSIDIPDLDDWGLAERLAAERESLGLYLSGHPFDQYRGDGPFVSSGSIGSLLRVRRPQGKQASWSGGKQAAVAGLVTGLRKRGNRVTLDLDDGCDQMEVTLFQESFESFRHLLVSHNIVVIAGKLRFDDFINAWRLTAESVTDIDRLIENRASGLVIRWAQGNGHDPNPAKLKSLLEPFRPGKCAVSLFYERSDATARMQLSGEWSVRPSRELRERLSALVGAEGFRFVYDSPPGPTH